MSTAEETGEEPTRVEPGPSAAQRVDAAADGLEPATGRGDQIGRYILVDPIGRGGMGEVFAAYDPELDRRVALKLLRVQSRRTDRRASDRLVREAQALAKLAHPNVVTVFDAGTHRDRVFVAMEHIQGITLKAWLAQGSRRWEEVVDVLREAGRGLAAAHAAGLVHRDFKPENVMIGEDGRPRVLDFGLARRFGPDDSLEEERPLEVEELPSLERSGPGPDVALTATGMVLGTPAYMAPEQFVGGRIDARTDQFAFCVVLYRGLFGAAPFAGDDYRSLARAVLEGALEPAPRGHGVPREIRAAIERGLSGPKAARFESMEPLLEILDRARSARRRRAVWGGAVVGVLGVSGAAVWGAQRAEPCEAVEQALGEAWSPERREAVADAFAATEAPFAEDASRRARELLDGYAEGWQQARRDACEATRVRGEQSEHLMDLRVACLDRRREQLLALTEQLARADAEVVQRAVEAAQQLPALERCRDAEALLAEVPPPEDPQVAAAVQRVQAETARAHAARLAGRYSEGIEIATAALDDARALGHLPTVAEVARVLGMLHERGGKPQLAFDRLDEALWAAIASGHTQEEAQALLALTTLEAAHHPDGIALRHARHASAVLDRLGRPPLLEAQAQLYTGSVHMRRREFDEAEAKLRAAIELSADLPQAQSIKLSALGNLASLLGLRGRYEEARRFHAEALALGEAQLGQMHPKIAKLLHNYGSLVLDAGEPGEAIAIMNRAIEVFEATVGPEHPELAQTLANLGHAHRALEDWPATLRYAEQSLAFKRKTLPPDHPSMGISHNNVGEALLHLGRVDEAVAELEEALRVFGDAPERAFVLAGYATALAAQGHPERAQQAVEECLAGMATMELSGRDQGRMRFEVAQVLWDLPGQRARSDEELAAARTALREAEGDMRRELQRIDAWVAERGEPERGTVSPPR